jgi:succinate dehydrogenase / fumarate reductase iron-sulfur subunit
MAIEMETSNTPTKQLVLRVRRANPAKSTETELVSYHVPFEPGMTVLNALLYVKEKVDHSVAIRYSCRMACCGSCGMKINGIPKLACYTQVQEYGDEDITVEPLDHYPLIRDLVTNFDGFFQKHKSVSPFLIRRNTVEQETSSSEYDQRADELDSFLQFSYCIKCGLCNAACPTVASDPLFTGPQALGQAYRYVADSRDEGLLHRIDSVDHEHGVWRCHFAGACSFVCPKGVDPALGIQQLRRLVITRKQRGGASLMPVRKPSQG